MTQATCISCSSDTDLVSVHDELSLDGTESLETQSSAAALAQYCFNFKIEKLDRPYGMCSACLGLLIQASSYKHHLLKNIESTKESKDAVRSILSNMSLSKRAALHAKRNELWNEVIERNNFKIEIDMKKLDFFEIESAADVSETLENNLKRQVFQSLALEPSDAGSRNCITENRKKKTRQRKQLKFETASSLNEKIKREFLALHRDCKDFYLFTWYQSKFKCVICNQLYGDIDEFKKHVRKHTIKQNKNIFPKKYIYRGPELKVDVSSMKCRYCDNRMTDFEEFRNHLSVAHKINADYLFNRILPFYLHRDEYKCGICNEVFRSVGNLNMHMNQHSTNYVCDHCEKPFATLHRLKNHVLRSHAPGTFKCFECDLQFESVGKRQYHTAHVHKRSYNLCPHCPSKFKSYVAKLKHLAEVHNEEARRYKCNICQSKFPTAGERGVHVRKIHLGERNHLCGLCGYAFFNKQSLTQHMVTHTGEKAFECDICDKAFGRKKTLIAHKKTHAVDKVKYACEFCERQYLCKGSLTVHLATCKNKLAMQGNK